MNDRWTNRLSEYLDGELGSQERAALEEHLATCGHCYAVLGELRQVVARAQSLQDAPPARDLWPHVAKVIRDEGASARLAVRPSARRLTFSVPQLLAASIALVLLSAGGMWVGLRATSQKFAASPSWVDRPAAGPQGQYVAWRTQTDATIAELEETLARNERQLDTSTVRVVRQNLAVIDRAIVQAQRALQRDPANSYLNLHLANTMRQKIDLLRRANALAAGVS
jgi:hypothetical protein